MAGVTAAHTLANASITDFVILEYNSDLGGRVAHTTFGTNPATNESYTVELGANWVQGISNNETGAVNPIWTLAQKYSLNNTYSNYSSILTYNSSGAADFADLIDVMDDAWTELGITTGEFIEDNVQDYSARAGFSLAGWRTGFDKEKEAVDWWMWDWEYAWREFYLFLVNVGGFCEVCC